MKYYTAFMHTIFENVDVPTLKTLAALPGTKTAYRVTVFYADRRARNSVATLVEGRRELNSPLEMVYEGFNGHQPIVSAIPATRMEALADGFARAGFDRLPDGQTPPGAPRTLWLVERAAGAFYKAVMFSPHEPVLPYSTLTNTIDDCLSEAIREMSI